MRFRAHRLRFCCCTTDGCSSLSTEKFVTLSLYPFPISISLASARAYWTCRSSPFGCEYCKRALSTIRSTGDRLSEEVFAPFPSPLSLSVCLQLNGNRLCRCIADGGKMLPAFYGSEMLCQLFRSGTQRDGFEQPHSSIFLPVLFRGLYRSGGTELTATHGER